MKPDHLVRLKLVVILLVILLTVMLLYTALHEGGHALAGVAFGGKITDFNVNFFNLSAHVGIDGAFTARQKAVFSAAGTLLPLFAWLLLMLCLPKKAGFVARWTKIICTMGFLNTLLTWIVLPMLYLRGTAPPSEDVTNFIKNSGVAPLAVTFGAIILYAAGWVVFALRIGNLRDAFSLPDAAAAPLPGWRRILAIIAVLTISVGAVALALNLLGIHDPAAPPDDYALVATIPLSERDYQSESIASFTLVEPAEVAIFLRVERINTTFIDLALLPSQGDPIPLLHGEGFSTDLNTSQTQHRLPAGEYAIVLNSHKSPGALKVYLHLP